MLKGLLTTPQQPVIQEIQATGTIKPTAEAEVQFNTKISTQLKQDLKLYCVKNGIEQKDFIDELIRKAIY
jgi:hypothetical protein